MLRYLELIRGGGGGIDGIKIRSSYDNSGRYNSVGGVVYIMMMMIMMHVSVVTVRIIIIIIIISTVIPVVVMCV